MLAGMGIVIVGVWYSDSTPHSADEAKVALVQDVERMPANEARTVLPPAVFSKVPLVDDTSSLLNEEEAKQEREERNTRAVQDEDELEKEEPKVEPSLDQFSGIHDYETSQQELAHRREILSVQVEELERQISSFDRPLSGEVGAILSDSARSLSDLEAELEDVRGTIEVATRKLAVWYGRRKRLQATHVLKLTNEVAISSEIVQGRKEEFDRATWEYLKEAEALRYDPSNEERKQQVAKLTQIRQEKLAELEGAVREAIDDEIGKADHRITELTLKRDRIQSDIEALRRRHAYAKILMHGTAEQKAEKRKSLQIELEVVKAELVELQDISGLPAPAEE